MAVVLDSSVVLAWLLPDESSARADQLLDQIVAGGIEMYAPQLMRYEVLNALASAGLRRRRISQQSMDRLIDQFFRFEITFDSPLQFPRQGIVEMVKAHELSVYDASYVELALRLVMPLVTLDRRLKNAAGKEGLNLPL